MGLSLTNRLRSVYRVHGEMVNQQLKRKINQIKKYTKHKCESAGLITDCPKSSLVKMRF